MTPEEHLEHLLGRRSVRRFADRAVERETIERLLSAATTAPSSTNRQPWRFAVVSDAEKRAAIVDAVRTNTKAIEAVIAKSHHAEDYGTYGDFFFEPLEAAPALIVPQYRVHDDLLANLIASGGGDPAAFQTPAGMPAEICATSAAVMLLLVQAKTEGLGACWMAGPTVAKNEISALLDIRAPWTMLGAIAVGHPDETPEPKPRKPLGRVVTWYEGEQS